MLERMYEMKDDLQVRDGGSGVAGSGEWGTPALQDRRGQVCCRVHWWL